MIIGFVAIARSDELAGGGPFLRRQMVWSVLAIVAALAAAVPNYRVFGRTSPALYAVALGLLVAVYFFPAVNGARRWIRLGPIGVQPSDLAKVALVLVLARCLMYRTDLRRLRGLVAPVGLTLLPALLVVGEPDLGTALVFVPVLFVMLFVAGARARHLAGLALTGACLLPALWGQMSLEQQTRVTSLFDQAGPNETARGDAYHLRQAKQVMALGGWCGSLVAGQAVDDPGAYHLPEARSDFILCVVGERMGLVGIAVVLGLYGLFIGRGLAIAEATREPFARLAAAGLVTLVAVQAGVNTAMTVGLLPITGLSLPWISYGGSGLVTAGIIVGLLVSLAVRPGYEVTNEPFRYAAD